MKLEAAEGERERERERKKRPDMDKCSVRLGDKYFMHIYIYIYIYIYIRGRTGRILGCRTEIQIYTIMGMSCENIIIIIRCARLAHNGNLDRGSKRGCTQFVWGLRRR